MRECTESRALITQVPSIHNSHLRNDLLCVEWDVKPYVLTHFKLGHCSTVLDYQWSLLVHTVWALLCGISSCRPPVTTAASHTEHPTFGPRVVGF